MVQTDLGFPLLFGLDRLGHQVNSDLSSSLLKDTNGKTYKLGDG